MADVLSFWSVDQPVFARSADPQRPYFSPRLKPVADRVLLLCQQGQPLIVVTGEPGTGKTMVLRWLHRMLDQETHEVLLTTLVKRETEAGWLTPRLAELFGVEGRAALDRSALIRATAAQLEELKQENRKLVVLIDAAHLAEGPGAFDELSSLLNLTAIAELPLTFVLAGAESIDPLLERAPELATRLALRAEITRLTREETAEYVAHRSQIAGLVSPFAEAALDFVHMKARGVPAALNVICDLCLIEAAMREQRTVTAEVVKAGASLSTPPRPAPEPRPLEFLAPLVPFAKVSGAGTVPPEREERAETASIKLSSLFKSSDSKR